MIIAVLLICATISGFIASSKNRNVVGWGALGLFLGLIGVLITALQDPLPSPQLAYAEPGFRPSSDAR
ncbi:MAG TPA: hypothetical protein VGM39_08745 [Kofleriaceae bacterium]|jgi:hypothetical protein